MTARSPKSKFIAQITFSVAIEEIGSQVTVGGMTIEEAKQAAKFYTSQDKGVSHIQIKENKKTYPEFEWVDVLSYNE